MKPPVKYALMGVGGVILLFGSFVTFAALSGAPLHEVALIKNFVKAPAEPAPTDPKSDPKTASEPAKTPAVAETGEKPGLPVKSGAATPGKHEVRAIEASVSTLGAFLLPSPFSADELGDLQREIRTASQGAKERLARIEERERSLDEYERDLEQRYKELTALRQELEKKELELTLREDEVKRDLDSRSARDAQSWKELAKFFEEGDPADLAKKIVTFDSKEAVRILRSLDDERAGQIVNALPPDKYHEYLEAYRAQTPKTLPKK